MQSKAILVRVVALAAITLVASTTSALASAGAPDPSFGTRGVLTVTTNSSKAHTSSLGHAVLLPEGGMIVPVHRTDYRIRKQERAGILRTSVQLRWLDADGHVLRTSAAIALPKDLFSIELARTADGHLLLYGWRGSYTTYSLQAKTLFLLRLTDNGVPEAAPGSTSATVNVAIRSIPHIVVPAAGLGVDGMSVAPSGRVYFTVSQSAVRTQKNPAGTKPGPIVIAAVDPSFGLVSGFAGGGLEVAAKPDDRTSNSVATSVDGSGRLLVLVRSFRNGVGGTSQDVHASRYDLAGIVDPTFANGALDIDGSDIDTAYSGMPSIAVLRNGDIVMRLVKTVDKNDVSAYGIELIRTSADGAPVASFGTNGRSFIVLRRRKSDNYSSSSGSYDGGSPAALFEQPDGKLIVGIGSNYSFGSPVSASQGDVLRATASGALDTTYEQRGFARVDIPTNGEIAPAVVGVDSEGRLIVTGTEYLVKEYSYETKRGWILRLLGGDTPAATPTSVVLHIDKRATCGAKSRSACFDTDGSTTITGTVRSGGKPLVGAPVTIAVNRPSSNTEMSQYVPARTVVTGAGGRFSLHLRKLLPGSWEARARVFATASSQRLDVSHPVYFTLGPRADIAMMHVLQRAQGLAVALQYVIDDTVDYGNDGDSPATEQCKDITDCFGRSRELMALVSKTAHPAPGKAGVILGKPDHYTIVTRADTTKFNLEFVFIETPDDSVWLCRGDKAARKRWCPDETWTDDFDDPFAAAGIDGGPFDYTRRAQKRHQNAPARVAPLA